MTKKNEVKEIKKEKFTMDYVKQVLDIIRQNVYGPLTQDEKLALSVNLKTLETFTKNYQNIVDANIATETYIKEGYTIDDAGTVNLTGYDMQEGIKSSAPATTQEEMQAQAENQIPTV